ncbi:gastrokine-1-like [Spea bombifrons]|uniref:gastrokine-1-like n=1 Tax=Spea bombifrons TaxID=233779 RepID=UPI00234B4374|nr:gastrokine-1-like [Spea bombifrons]
MCLFIQDMEMIQEKIWTLACSFSIDYIKEIILTTILGALFASSLANDNVDINNEGNVGSNVHQTVNINNQDKVASVNTLNGWDSWDSICDYGRGFVATRPFGKKICVVSKMDKQVFPGLEAISTATQQKQLSKTPVLFKYNINQVPIANIGIYGVHIEALCKGIPSYTAEVKQGPISDIALCDTGSIFDFGGISFCF